MFDLGIVFATYGCLRLYEKYKVSKQKTPVSPKAETTDSALDVVVEPEPAVIEGTIDSGGRAENLHYMKASAASFGLALLRNSYPPVAFASLAVFTYTAIPYLRQIEKSLLTDKKVDGYVLYGIADFMTLGLKRYATAAFAIGLVHTAKFIISNAEDNSKKSLIDIFDQQPRTVWVLQDGIELELALEEITTAHVVVVNTGEIIPVDGRVIHGMATVDQQALTGESQPAEKMVGDLVFASTLLITGQIHIQVTQSGQATTVAQITQILNKSIDFKTSTQLRGEKWADSWNLPVLGLAFLSWPILGPVGTVVILNGHIAQTIRVVAPLGTLNHLSIAAHQGILIKDGRVLEDLHGIDTLLFDKTGTLTSDEPVVGRVICCHDDYSSDDIMRYAAAAERKLAHPIARAIVNRAHDLALVLPEIEEAHYKVGYGITVRLGNQLIRVGSSRFMAAENLPFSETVQTLIQSAQTEGHSLIMVAIDNDIAGILELHASVRPEVKALIQSLRQRGIKHLAIVSGDHQHPTQRLAEQLGMDDYFYDVLPQDKANIVAQLQAQGRTVCFIGDGVNDAIAMKKANISISLSGATSIATDTAQIVLMDGSLKRIPDLIDISINLERNLQNSLLINIIPGAITIASAFLFRIDIIAALIISQGGLAVGVVNAMLPLRQIAHKKPALEPVTDEKHMLLSQSTPAKEIEQSHPFNNSD